MPHSTHNVVDLSSDRARRDNPRWIGEQPTSFDRVFTRTHAELPGLYHPKPGMQGGARFIVFGAAGGLYAVILFFALHAVGVL